MLMTIGLLSFVGMIVFIVKSVKSKAKKDGQGKKNLLIAGSCFVVMAICASLDDTPVESEVAEKKETKEVATTKEKEVKADNTDIDEAKKKADEVEAKKKEEAEKLKLEEEKKKEELVKQEAAKVKAEEDKKVEAAKLVEKANSEEEINNTFQLLIELSEGIIVEIKQNPYGMLDWQQMHVVVSDVWYSTPEHEKERFAESVSLMVENAIHESGVIEADQTILTHFVDTYGKELATEKVFGGYKIKR